MKRTLSILMALLLLWSLALPAAAAETTASTTLRLEKTEGTVKVSNASGKSVTVTDGMRLYSGYTIATEKSSYAYVSLDGTKAVKLDASSKVEVQKSGKKLELSLSSGNLFFNVTAPLEKDESLTIRTSTMVTGIRGTSGWAAVRNMKSEVVSELVLLTGAATTTAVDPFSSTIKRTLVTGGQIATAAMTQLTQSVQQLSLFLSSLKESEVPGFVAIEVEKDPILQQKIAEESQLSPEEIIEDADTRLSAEQEAAEEQDQIIQEEQNNIAIKTTKQVFVGVNTTTDSGDSSSDSSQVDPTPPPEPEEPSSPTVSLDGPTAAELKAALETSGVTNVTVTNAGANDLSTESYTVSSGQTLDIQSGTFTVGSGQTLDVAGTLTNSATLDVAGTANVTGTADNSGTITVTSTNSLHVAGTLTNTGTIQVGGTAPGLLEISGTLNNTSGSITVAGNSSLTGTGSLNNDKSLTNAGNFSLITTGTFTCKGTYTENRTDQLYAMAKSTDGTVYYLGPAAQMSGWYADTTVTLLGAYSSGMLPGGTVNASNVTLDLDGHTVDLTAYLEVTAGNTMTIQDTAGGGTLSATNLSDEGLYGLKNSGTLTMNGVSTDCPLYNSGTLTLTDSSVAVSSDCAITNDGSSAVMTVAGSSTVSSDASAALTETPVAIYNQSGATLYVKGGSISVGDGSTVRGTGIMAEGGRVTVSSGVVSGGSGVGIEARDGCNVLISGGEVTSTDGDSVFLNNSALTLEGGKITSVSGLGIGVSSDVGGDESGNVVGGSVTMTGGEVTNTGGTAISVFGGEARISGGAVTNTVSTAISVSDGEVFISGGTVETSGGAGIDMTGGIATISGGTVTSTSSIGMEVKDNATVIISGGEISSYSAGIYMFDGTVNLSGTGKVSSTSYVGINVNAGTVTVSGGEVAGIQGGITNTTQVAASVTISGGTITVTDNDPATYKLYAVSGPFTFSGGTLRAMAEANCFNSTPVLPNPNGQTVVVEQSEPGGYYTASVKAIL